MDDNYEFLLHISDLIYGLKVENFTTLNQMDGHLLLKGVSKRSLLEWILQNMVRHYVIHKQVQADKRHPI